MAQDKDYELNGYFLSWTTTTTTKFSVLSEIIMLCPSDGGHARDLCGFSQA